MVACCPAMPKLIYESHVATPAQTQRSDTPSLIYFKAVTANRSNTYRLTGAPLLVRF